MAYTKIYGKICCYVEFRLSEITQLIEHLKIQWHTMNQQE